MGGIAWSIEWFDPSVQTSTALTHFTAGEQDRFQDAGLGQRDRSVFSETNMVINEHQHAHVRVCDVESSSGAAGDTHTHTRMYSSECFSDSCRSDYVCVCVCGLLLFNTQKAIKIHKRAKCSGSR